MFAALLGLLCGRVVAADSPGKKADTPPKAKAGVPSKALPKPTLANVAYGTHERQVLDFYKAESAKPTPVVFFLHGGGWVRGDKSGVGSVPHPSPTCRLPRYALGLGSGPRRGEVRARKSARATPPRCCSWGGRRTGGSYALRSLAADRLAYGPRRHALGRRALRPGFLRVTLPLLRVL
jgi:hypothetical protein